MMPQTKTQGAVFGLLMSYFMALGMEVANVAHKLGAMSNAVFLPALKETAFVGAIVFVVFADGQIHTVQNLLLACAHVQAADFKQVAVHICVLRSQWQTAPGGTAA